MQAFGNRLALSHSATMMMLSAAISKAEEIGQPQCKVIIDTSGELHGEVRMTGAKFLSRKSARGKARTAASNGAPTVKMPDSLRAPMAVATQGEVTALPGGLPIIYNGQLVGGIGIGSGSGEQDLAVANAALAAISADTFEGLV